VLALGRQRLYQIRLGYEDANDADTLRFDPALKLAVGRTPSEPDLASQPTLSRLEHQVGWHGCWRMSEALLEGYLQRHQASPPTRLVLDVDATDGSTHGQQELSFYHGFCETHRYLPLLVFAQAEGSGEQELLCAVLRPGNAHAGQRAMAVLRRVVTRLRQAFPECQIELRADSGLALPEIHDGCEALALLYTISLPRNERLEALAQPWLRDALAIYEETAETVQVFGECCYAAHSWPHARRVIAKAEVMTQGISLRFAITSDPDLSPRERYVFYCQRGDPENRIKELKQGLAMDRLSCHRFWANRFRLLLHAAAYVLFQQLRALLAGTELATARVETLRLRLLKVGPRVRESVRRVWVQLPQAYRGMAYWQRVAEASG
jgi:hypothetical protein